jgi:hypothetical protein
VIPAREEAQDFSPGRLLHYFGLTNAKKYAILTQLCLTKEEKIHVRMFRFL